MKRLLVAALVLGGTVACQPATAAPSSSMAPAQLLAASASLGVPTAAVVMLDHGDAAAARSNGAGRVEVAVLHSAADGSRTVSTITSKAFKGLGNQVGLFAYGGATGSSWNAFVFGTAAPGVTAVALDWPGAVGGSVYNGAWLIVLPDKDMTPDRLHWTFLGPDRSPAASGSGITG